MAYSVNSLPEYVEVHKGDLIKKAVLGGDTLKHIGLQFGIKHKEQLNLVDVTATVQSGGECSFKANGDASFTNKEISVVPLKVNMEFCDEDLRAKYLNYEIVSAARKSDLPFEQAIVDGVSEDIERILEKAIWQGGNAAGIVASPSTTLKGFLEKFEEDSTVNKVTFTSDSAYDRIKQMILALPQELVDGGAKLFIGKDMYRLFIADLMELNLYHYTENESENATFRFPGFSTEIVAVNGLNGTNKIVGAKPSHLIYGTDLNNDKEDFDIWYSKDEQRFKLAVKWVSGVEYPFGDEIYVGQPA